MLSSINSADNRKQMIVKTAVGAGVGAGVAAGAFYALQKRAIKNEKAAQENTVNIKGIKKWALNAWETVKGWAKAAKVKYTNAMDEIAKSGKISKIGLAKAAGIGAVVVGSIALVKSIFANKKDAE